MTLPSPTKWDRIESDFWDFHTANPDVYAELRSLALRLRRQGRKFYGIKALYEVVRFNHAMSKTPHLPAYGVEPKELKINNNFTALYARLLMEREPKLKGFFATRKRRTPGASS